VLDCPNTWDLTDPPRFTEQEVEDAKTLIRMLPYYTKIERSSYLYLEMDCSGCEIILNSDIFHSIKEGETVSLKEIAGYTDV
jgi:hypothetical protein